MPRPLRALALLLLIHLVALAVAAPAFAQTLPRLQGQVTDLSRGQLLAQGRSSVDAALADLLRDQDVQLWVLFVETTGSRSVTQFADEVARANSLGGNDALLVVAVADRTDALWRGSASLERLTDRELEEVLSRRVEPRLASGDFLGAVVGAAQGLAGAAGGSGVADAAGGLGLSSLLPIALLGGGGFWLWRAFSRRRGQAQAAQAAAQRTEARAQEANALLIQADEMLRDAQQEIGFAEAQFGEAEVAPYRQALAAAQDELKAAFALRQQLDDATPETPEQRHQMVEGIVERAGRAGALLDEQRKRIEQLRDLERTAPEVLAALPAQLDALAARVPAAERTLAGLARYADSAWASVRENPTAASRLIDEARAAVEEGQRALAAAGPAAPLREDAAVAPPTAEAGQPIPVTSDRAAGGRAARTAQQAATEAAGLLDAVESTAEAIRKAEGSAPAQVAAAEADLRAAAAALAESGRSDLRTQLAEAASLLEDAQRQLAAARPDPLAASRLATQADATADQVLAELKAEAERRERERRILVAQLQAAETSYYRAADFIAPRRRVIGSGARTRLAEAERHLERAQQLANDDPAAALAEARRAQQLADAAYQLAADDLDTYGGQGGWTGFPRGGVAPMPIPFPIPTGGWGGGFGGGGFGGGGGGGSGGGSVGGRW